MNGRAVVRAMVFGVGAALLLASWYFLAPPQLGGRTAYVTSVGTSMKPVLEPGDLVVVRRSSAYGVGDVVAYRNLQLDTVVLHRIVAREGERYVLQGDSNTWLDSYRPSEEEVLGAMVVRLPGVGARLGAVRSPIGATSVLALGALGVLGGGSRLRSRRGRHKERRDPVARAEPRAEPPSNGRVEAGRHGRVTVFAAFGAVGLAVGALAFLQPTTRQVTHDVVYDQRGTFSYTARVPGGESVYGGDVVTAGDPIYLRLADRVQVSFRYGLSSRAAADLTGTVGMVVELSDVNGWSRTLELAPPSSFEGPEAAVGGVLDLSELLRLTAELERATGVDRLAYAVAVVPRVEVRGTLAGRPVAETFEPRLAFLLDDLQLQLPPEGPAAPGEDPARPLEPASGGLVKVSAVEPRTFEAFGFELGLQPLRVVCVLLVLVGATGLGLVFLRRVKARREGEPALIQARYGQWLVPVHTNGGYAPGRLVEVESFESLLRLANHYGHMVLHDLRDDGHVYVVEESGVTYRYRSRSAAAVRR